MAKNAKVKVLNDYFPKEVQEDILKDEPTLFHQTYIQDAIDKYVKPGDYVEMYGTFNLKKLVGYREVFLRRNQDTVVETATLPESTV